MKKTGNMNQSERKNIHKINRKNQMKTIGIRIWIATGFFILAYPVFSQFKFTSSEVIGQVLTVDTLQGIGTLQVHFNTSSDSSYWVYDDETQTSFTLNIAKCQTRKGLEVKVYDENGLQVENKDFECNNFGGYRNPVRVSDVATVMDLLQKSKEKNAGTEDSLRNLPFYPAACLFDLDDTGNDQAFGAYPGKFKRVEYGFRFSFEGVSVTDRDIVFEVDTYDEGNTGLTAAYAFLLAIGHKDSVVAEISDFYISGSGKKIVRVAEAAGISVTRFANENVYFYLKTTGTGTQITESSMDPILVFDNFSVSYQMPMWVEPEAGINNNGEYSNENNIIQAETGKDSLVSIHLKTSGRLGDFVIINDREEEETKRISLLPEGGVKANDGNGNYTVDIPYDFTPGDIETKAKMVIAAPETGTIDDDFLLYVNVKPGTSEIQSGRLELDCGVRIWYDLFMQGIPATSADRFPPGKTGFYVYPNPASTKIYIAADQPHKFALYHITGTLVKSKRIDAENNWIDVSHLPRGVYFVQSLDQEGFVRKIVLN
jgi:hypothetical protein